MMPLFRSNPAARRLLLAALLMVSATGLLAQDAKPVIRTETDIPRYTYELATETASALLVDDAAFNTLAASVKADLLDMLDRYQIEDHAALRDFYNTLEALAVMEGDYETALAYAEKRRELADKPAARYMTGVRTIALAAAAAAGDDEAARKAAYTRQLTETINGMPWEVVQDDIEQMKGSAEIITENVMIGIAQTQLDPAVAQSGQLSGEFARGLVGMRRTMKHYVPYNPETVAVLSAYIAANRVEKPDIWAARAVDLSGRDDLSPVVVGVWDSGVDAAVFGEAMFVNPAESMNGTDDDGNGYVDDVHGIAYSLWGGDPVPELLYPLSEAQQAAWPDGQALSKGFSDLQASVDSDEATALKQRMGAMQPGDVQPFLEELGLYGNYSHGTHVAGIAAAGTPAAKILLVRETFPHETVPKPILKADAEKWAANMQRTVDYLKTHGVRVVNMSWGASAADLEGLFEINGIGADAEERKAMAQEVFGILIDGMREAMASAPEILFVPAAGNSDESVEFTETMPSSIALPNVLTVGAVDQAGEEAAFTSYGKNVRAHANGFEVDSYVPGGNRLKYSGTSMAAPNATNLAAKLFALDPSLTPEEAVKLILDGADRSDDGRRVLINPKRSIELLAERG